MICLCLVSILIANPIHRVRELDFVPATHFQHLHGQGSQSTRTNANGKLCNSSDQSCELHRKAQDLDTWRDLPYELLSPIHHAALALQGFYDGLLPQVNKQWSLQALSPRYWIRQDKLDCFLPSVGGPIPWSVVSRFVDKMVCRTVLGWIATYDKTRQNVTTEQAIGMISRTINNQLSLPSSHPTSPGTVKETKNKELKKRTQRGPIEIKVVHPIMPIALAAPHVKAFFDAVATEAASTWTSRAEAALLTVTQAPFQLTVSCLGGQIPWSTLAVIAQRFSALVDRSWVNTFDAFYQVADSAAVLAVSLRLLDNAKELGTPTLAVPSAPKRTAPRTLPAAAQSSPNTPLLHPRTPPTSPLLPRTRLITEFTKTLAFLPVAIAAHHFEDFYTILAVKIETGQLAPVAPSKRITVSLWDFELTFESENTVVPWSFVQAFAIDMAEWSARSWTGFYEAVVRGEGGLSGLVIFVRMWLKGAGGGGLVRLNPS